MISDRYRCVFIHIPKNAGTSIEKKLGLFDKPKRGIQDHRTIREIEPFLVKDMFTWLGANNNHFLLKRIKNMLKRQLLISASNYKIYYKFAIVRNSWSRVFSWYSSVMRDKVLKKELGLSENCTFYDFLNEHMEQWALKPQLHWLKDKHGDIPLDFIGRFENLEKDFLKIATDLGMENIELPKLNIGKTKDYSQFYDDRTKDIVAEAYKEEIELFKFKFGE